MTFSAGSSVSLRERNRQQTRDLLLRTAVELMAARGVSRTTMDDIARSAGTSRATVYAYFPGRDEILAALADQMYARTEELYRSFRGVQPWSAATIRAWLDTVVERWETDLDLVRVYMECYGSGTHDHRERHEQLVTALVGDGTGEWARFAPTERRNRAMALITQLSMFLSIRFVHGWEIDRDDLLDLLTESWTALLHCRPG